MRKLLRSFAAGIGSVLSVYPTRRVATGDSRIMEAIGGDFASVGGDFSKAVHEKSRTMADTNGGPSNGQEQAEQLDLISV